MKIPNPRCFGVWRAIGKKVEAEKPNRVSAKCAIFTYYVLGAMCIPEGTFLLSGDLAEKQQVRKLPVEMP
jgi:hypothetical protein